MCVCLCVSINPHFRFKKGGEGDIQFICELMGFSFVEAAKTSGWEVKWGWLSHCGSFDSDLQVEALMIFL